MAFAPVRVVLVGAGRWGRIYLRNILERKDYQLVGLASSNPSAASLAPSGCVVDADWRRILSGCGADAAIVATPPSTHAKIGCFALSAGLHVLVEKPVTLKVEEAEGLLAAAIAAKRSAFVDHIHLAHPAYRRLKEIVRAASRISGIRGRAGNHGPYRADTSVLWDWGPHDIAMCVDLMAGLPLHARAQTLDRRLVDGSVAECIRIELAYPGAIPVDIVVSTLDDRHRLFEVDCDGRTLVYDGVGPTPLREKGGASIVVDHESPLSVVLAEFARAVSAGDANIDGLKLAVEVTRVLAECDRLLRAEPTGLDYASRH